MSELTYDKIAEEIERLTLDYLGKVYVAPPGNPINHDGVPTSDVLLSLWQEYRAAVHDIFKKGGWTESAFNTARVQRVKESTSA